MKQFLSLTIFFILISSLNASEYSLKKIIKLKEPWGSTFLDKEKLLITEKSGSIKVVNLKNNNIDVIKHNLNVIEYGQGGLLDIIFQNGNVWVSYTEDRGNYKTSTSIAKGKYNSKKIEFKNIFQADPPIDSPYHFGSRLGIKGNFLFASVGERGQGMIAQDGSKHPGSIIRIHLDGKIPKDNPKFLSQRDWLPEIFQIGIRNPQGLVVSPFDNKVYISNHGKKVVIGLER